ncbi:hypothetical protein DYB31_007897, partial [Aphanomyces astaci]
MDTERDPLHSRLTKTDDATSPISDIPEQLSPPRTSQQTPEDHSPAASPEGMRSTPTSPTPSEVDMDTSEPDEEPCVQRLVSTTLPPTGRSATDEHNDAVPHLPAAGAQPTITAEEVFQARVQTTVSPSIVTGSIASMMTPAPETIDLSDLPAPQAPQMDFVRKGTLQSLLEHHPWQVGTVAALGQCCVLALYCAKHGHAWSGRSHHDVRIIEAIKDLKTAIRDVVQAHPAFTGHYMPRWPHQLEDSAVQSRGSVDDYIHQFFARLIAAHPAQGIPKRDWCGYPEIGAAAAVWGHPVYVLQEQQVDNTWWLWRVGFTTGATDIDKVPIPTHQWEDTLAKFTPTTVLLAHKGGNHFDPIHMTAPRSAPAPNLTPLLQPSRKLPTKYAKAVTQWMSNNKEGLTGRKFPAPITTVAEIEPLFADFPRTARVMLFTLGNPETLLSKLPLQVLMDWGDHMLLKIVYATMDAIRDLFPHKALHTRLDRWKDAIFDAPTLPLAMTEALSDTQWSSLLQVTEIPLAIYDGRLFTSLSPTQRTWAAIVGVLLNKDGIEIDELPDIPTLGNLLTLGDLPTILDHLSKGKWALLWPWVEKHHFAPRTDLHPTSTLHRSTTAPAPSHQAPSRLRLLTQNVAGFRRDTVAAWMDSWKAHITHDRLDIICIQETHVSSPAQARQLTESWTRLWGLTNTPHPIAFWTVTANSTNGVAILLNPYSQLAFTQDNTGHTTPGRYIQIHSPSLTVASLYAPSTNSRDRQEFFHHLATLTPPTTPFLVGGDFNCVSHPRWDRQHTNPKRPPNPECDGLETWLTRQYLHDSIWQTRRPPKTSADAQSFLQASATCIRPQSKSISRIDRIYVSESLRNTVKAVTTHPPGQRSDHNAVCLLIGSPPPRGNDRIRLYPIRSAHPTTLSNRILAHIDRHAPHHSPPGLIGEAWDKFIAGLQELLLRLQELERPPPPPPDRLDNPVTRLIIIDEAAQHLRDISEYKHGSAIYRGDAPSRRFFLRFTDKWDSGSLPDISPPDGHPSGTSADNMANGWRAIMSSSHGSNEAGRDYVRTSHPEFLRAIAGRLKHASTSHLMAPITPQELTTALARMAGSKSPGPDGIPNGFFHKFQKALTPSFLALFNSILLGHGMPRSFSEADVIPLKKKGNSPHALDYRPIALLNSAYKLFAQIIALRLQPLLHQAIGAQQQGFVPGRTLANSIGLLQRALEEQSCLPDTPMLESAAIICLDIQKAYDSLERPHLECTMSAMGFPPAFVVLISRLHEHTTVRFVVNGTKSAALAQSSGIRQGCPLAPSLFILGMEPLLASLQNLAWDHGILIPDGPSITPLICNAHVDDTALYLRHLSSLPLLLDILRRFGDMSGLRVQPHKSFGICLNKAHHPTRLHDIPFIEGGGRRRYLGLQVGLGGLADANWEQCYNSTVQRLRVASSKTTSLPARARLLQAIVQSKVAFLATYTLHPATTPQGSGPYENSMKYGQILASTALSQRMKRPTLDRDATQAFLLAAKTACTYTWDHTGRCSCHMPPELVIAARHLQISLCRDTTLAWRQLLWHNQVTHNDWIRDHNSRPLQSAPFDTFADAF